MSRRVSRAFMIWVVFVGGASAQDPPSPSATIELLLPRGATATVDGKPVEYPRAMSVTDFKKDEIRRIKIAVTFAGGTVDERLVDVAAGQRLRVAIPEPGPERAFVIGAQPLVPINAAAVSPVGTFIALGTEARTVVLWDTATGRPIRTLAGHQKPVLCVAFSPDGKTLLSGSADTTVMRWDVETGKPLRTYKGHTGAVVSVAFGPDGKRFLTGSPEGVAIHWDAETGEQVHKLKGRNILAVAYSPDGNRLGTASADGTATLWDAATGKQTFVLRGHREDVNCLSFSPDSRRAVTGSSDDTGAVWDVATGTRITRTARHTVNIHSATFTPDGRRVITGEREELVIMSDAANGTPVRTFVGHGAEIQSIVPSPDGKTMLTASRDGTARIWDLTTGRELMTLTTDGTGKAWAAVSPEGLFDGSEGGRKSLGYRFPKGGVAEVDQYFARGFRPGLLAEVWRGDRPLPTQPLGRNQSPLAKIVAPKRRISTDPTVTLTAEITDWGSGVGAIVVENNGIRLAVPTKSEPGTAANMTRVSFTVPLLTGANRIGVRASDRDGSRESAAAEIELTHPKGPGQRGRFYVVAVGIGEGTEKGGASPSSKKDALALTERLRDRAGNLFDRVDFIPVFDRDATRATIEDTVRDVSELSRPHDTILILLCGRGALKGDQLYLAPHELLPGNDNNEALRNHGNLLDDIAAAMGRARALNRMLVIDAPVPPGDLDGRSEFGLRGTVERWGRTNGLHILANITPSTRPGEPPITGEPVLIRSLRDAASGNAMDVTDWFHSSAERAISSMKKVASTDLGVLVSTRMKGFPIRNVSP